jgi:hypothetical protein
MQLVTLVGVASAAFVQDLIEDLDFTDPGVRDLRMLTSCTLALQHRKNVSPRHYKVLQRSRHF